MIVLDDSVVQAQLQERCWFWQRVLQLQDWHVHVRVVPHNHPKLNEGIASCEMWPDRRDAIIRVVRPADLPAMSHLFLDGEEADYDLSLVHELLHLHMEPLGIEDETPAAVAEEQAVNAISRGLVTLVRTQGGAELPSHPTPGLYLTVPAPPVAKPQPDPVPTDPPSEPLPTQPPQAMVDGYF